MDEQDGSTVLRTSLVAGLIGLGLVAAVIEVHAELTPGTVSGSRTNARQAYLNALIRAHRDGSIEGMRRTAAAFAALGDHAVATQCLRVADELAAANRKGI